MPGAYTRAAEEETSLATLAVAAVAVEETRGARAAEDGVDELMGPLPFRIGVEFGVTSELIPDCEVVSRFSPRPERFCRISRSLGVSALE